MDSTIVRVPIENEYNFPKNCPITGMVTDISVSMKTSPSGFYGIPIYLLGLTKSIEIPISSHAGNRLLWSPVVRNIFNAIFILPVIIVCIYFDFSRFKTILIALVCWSPFLIWQVYRPLPVEFRDERYALEFAELNNGIIEDDIEPLHNS